MKVRPLLLSSLALVALAGAAPDTTLEADRLSVSLSRGGVQELVIDMGSQYAGKRYLLTGSSSGSFPGTLRDDVRVPLNFDKYSELVLARANGPYYAHFSGHLDKHGRATARLTMPPSKPGTLVGHVYHHAAVVIEPKTGLVMAASNPVEVLLLP